MTFFQGGCVGEGVVPNPSVLFHFALGEGGGIVLLGGRNFEFLLIVGASTVVVVHAERASKG